MRHYRINKLAKVDGVVVKKKDILAGSDSEAGTNSQRVSVPSVRRVQYVISITLSATSSFRGRSQ